RGLELLEHGPAAVRAAIVDEDHLVRAARRIERLLQACDELAERVLAPIHGDDDADVHGHDAAATTRQLVPIGTSRARRIQLASARSSGSSARRASRDGSCSRANASVVSDS